MQINNTAFTSPVLINSLGFSSNEKAVFEALISLNMAQNVSRIARTAKLPRTTTLYILHKFKERKLVTRVTLKKRAKWMYNRQTNHVLTEKITQDSSTEAIKFDF